MISDKKSTISAKTYRKQKKPDVFHGICNFFLTEFEKVCILIRASYERDDMLTALSVSGGVE